MPVHLPTPPTDWISEGLENIYIIIALDRGSASEPWFWRHNALGYTTLLIDAGTYHKNVIEAMPMYYNNGENTLAVPLCFSALDALGICNKWEYTGPDQLKPFLNIESA